MIIVYILLAVIGLIILITAVQATVLALQKPAQELPEDKDFDYYSSNLNGRKIENLYQYLSGKSDEFFTEEDAYEIIYVQSDYMFHRFDCSDFRAQMLFKLYKDCGDKLSERSKKLIKDTFLNFKYFMDEPGDDSMCYWSENHQLLFAVSEYLAGQEWQDEFFFNSGMSGKEHKEKAVKRIDAWMTQRFKYGFSEYLSNNYIAEDLAPMANFIAFCQDKKYVEKMKTVMNILWLDIALNSVNNRFVAVSSRMYGNNKSGNYYGNSIQAAMNVLWGKELAQQLLNDPDIPENEKKHIRISADKQPNSIVMCFTDIVEKGIYVLPEAIKDIALSKESFVSKMGCGLSPDDMVSEGLVGQEPHQIMAQLGAETFTNPQVIKNTLKYMKTNKMYRNSFVSYFKYLNVLPVKFLNIEKLTRKYNIMTHGIATGRGNVYTYRTAKYSLSTSFANRVDMCGAQDHVWSANLSETLALFSTHPAGNGENRYSSSPGYWIGNGRRPMSVQNESVNITVYKLPTKKRLAEMGNAKMTHLYMPQDFYDEFELDGSRVFARKNGIFVSVISDGEMKFKPYDKETLTGLNSNLKGVTLGDEYIPKKEFDLCRFGGDYHIYITELSDSDRETYEEFKARIRNNKASFDGGKAEYNTYFGSMSVSYDGDFKVNGERVNMEFDRYDSRFCKSPRKSDTVYVDSGKHTLTLSL